MRLSDTIAEMIEELIREGDGTAELARNDLAERIGCVPSQINYVITSRFTPERGYIIESRRGGGGYIRITRRRMDRNSYLAHCLQAIGDSIDPRSAAAFLSAFRDSGFITPREAVLVSIALNYCGESGCAAALRQIMLALME